MTRKRRASVSTIDDQQNRDPKRSKAEIASSDVRYGFSLSQPSSSDEHQLSHGSAVISPKGHTGPKKNVSKKAPKRTTVTTSAQEEYKEAIKSVDKKFNELLRLQEPNPTEFHGVTSDTISSVMASSFLPITKKILDSSPPAAFNLLMYIGEHSYGDVETCFKSSGFGGTQEPFREMDDVMVEIINRRHGAIGDDGIPQAAQEEFNVEASEDEGELLYFLKMLGEKRPNKSEYSKIKKFRRADLKNRFKRRGVRREKAEDWVSVALRDLVETRDRIEQYGIGRHFFPQSIARLAELKGKVVHSLN
ncbi:hypothetical protein B7463_g4521, partial [Scytalidium lignicola]